MPYKVKAWIPCTEEDAPVYPTKEEAEAERLHAAMMQPENIYQVVVCDKTEPDAQNHKLIEKKCYTIPVENIRIEPA